MIAQAARVIRIGHGAEHVAHRIGENAHNSQTGEEGVKCLKPNLARGHVGKLILGRTLQYETKIVE